MTDVQIANMALDILGVDRISALTDPSRFAKAAALSYPAAVDTVVGAYDWPFAKAYVRPVLNTTVTNLSGFEYAYDLPAGRVLSFADQPFKIVGAVIYSDQAADEDGNPILTYISTPAVSLWPQTFALLVAYQMAYLMAELVGKGAMRGQLLEMYNLELSKYVTRDIREVSQAETHWYD
jgi:hypothetical protein